MYSDHNMVLTKGHVALMRLLDRNAAYDTVDHDALLKRLEVSYCSINWVTSYLADRVQAIVVNLAVGTVSLKILLAFLLL